MSKPVYLNEKLAVSVNEEVDKCDPISEKDLDPQNWSISCLETDCGYPCTPDGCCGHKTNIPERLDFGNGGYMLSFPTEELCDSQDAKNWVAIGDKLKEVIQFYVKQQAGRAKLVEAHRVMFERYAKVLSAYGHNPVKADDVNLQTYCPHLLWMCTHALTFLKTPDFPLDKASRWLGFVQGCLIHSGTLGCRFTVQSERDFSRPLFEAAYQAMS